MVTVHTSRLYTGIWMSHLLHLGDTGRGHRQPKLWTVYSCHDWVRKTYHKFSYVHIATRRSGDLTCYSANMTTLAAQCQASLPKSGEGEQPLLRHCLLSQGLKHGNSSMSDIITNATEENCCEYGGVLALFPGLLRFYPLVCVQYNTWKWKSGEKQRRPGNTYRVNGVRWTRGGRRGRGVCIQTHLNTWKSSTLSLGKTLDVHKIMSTLLDR